MSWTYTEYTNGACSHYADYHQSYYCGTDTYTDYSNGAYINHSNGGSATYHNNYSNASYRNHYNVTACHNYSDHHNHTNYAMADRGVAITLNWTSPWGGTAGNRILGEDYVTNSIDAIKELRDNISGNTGTESTISLKDKLSYGTTATDPAQTPDTDFDDSDPGTEEYILPRQNNNLKSNLDKLWASIRGDDDASEPGTTGVLTGDLASKADWELLANKADELAAYADPSYKNHVDYADKGAGGSAPN